MARQIRVTNGLIHKWMDSLNDHDGAPDFIGLLPPEEVAETPAAPPSLIPASAASPSPARPAPTQPPATPPACVIRLGLAEVAVPPVFPGEALFVGLDRCQLPATATQKPVFVWTTQAVARPDAAVNGRPRMGTPNHHGSVGLAERARAAGVRRFIYASSCSIYGAGGDDWRTEDSATAPQTAYARCKILVEDDLRALRDDRFIPVMLRNATAFGASPRQRFDIVLNNLCGLAQTTGRIVLTSDGSPWRPIVHVQDICTAVLCALEADPDAVAAEAFNVGSDDGNHRIRDIADIVGRVFTGAEVEIGKDGGDTRSYRVSFAKIRDRMPTFATAWDAERGARQLKAVFDRIGLTEAVFLADPFTRLKELGHLQRTGQLDARLCWTAEPAV